MNKFWTFFFESSNFVFFMFLIQCRKNGPHYVIAAGSMCGKGKKKIEIKHFH